MLARKTNLQEQNVPKLSLGHGPNLFENQLLDLTMFPFFLVDALVVLGGSGEQLKIFL